MSRRLLSSFGLCLAAAIAFGVIQEWKAARTKSLSNLKQTALATLMYTADSDDVLPRTHETKSMFAALYPYVKNLDVFKSANPGAHFVVNPSVGGILMSDAKNPADTILYYEDKPWPDGSHLAVFCDGHAKALSGADWTNAQKSLHLKLKPKAKYLPKDYWKTFHIKGLPD